MRRYKCHLFTSSLTYLLTFLGPSISSFRTHESARIQSASNVYLSLRTQRKWVSSTLAPVLAPAALTLVLWSVLLTISTDANKTSPSKIAKNGVSILKMTRAFCFLDNQQQIVGIYAEYSDSLHINIIVRWYSASHLQWQVWRIIGKQDENQ